MATWIQRNVRLGRGGRESRGTSPKKPDVPKAVIVTSPTSPRAERRLRTRYPQEIDVRFSR